MSVQHISDAKKVTIVADHKYDGPGTYRTTVKKENLDKWLGKIEEDPLLSDPVVKKKLRPWAESPAR
jgi:hypothetical protein